MPIHHTLKPYSEVYPRKGKTQQVEGLTTRPPRSTAPSHHLKRLVHNVPPQTTTHTGYRCLLPRGTTTETTRHSSTSKTSTNESPTHEPQPVAKHESERTTPPHGTDYWFMTPVSNPDNTAQELPLSLAATD
ncbi:hypothetical protein Taro_056080, partial [Colocasia esculenta]|nr:hypothetical protein [Colocasia esculenta]